MNGSKTPNTPALNNSTMDICPRPYIGAKGRLIATCPSCGKISFMDYNCAAETGNRPEITMTEFLMLLSFLVNCTEKQKPIVQKLLIQYGFEIGELTQKAGPAVQQLLTYAIAELKIKPRAIIERTLTYVEGEPQHVRKHFENLNRDCISKYKLGKIHPKSPRKDFLTRAVVDLIKESNCSGTTS